MNAIRTISIFILAGLAEIGGVYLIWQWIRAPPSWIQWRTKFIAI